MVRTNSRRNILIVIVELTKAHNAFSRITVPAGRKLLQQLLSRLASILKLRVYCWVVVVYEVSDGNFLISTFVKLIICCFDSCLSFRIQAV